MKLPILLTLGLCFLSNQEPRLTGTYRAVFDKKYAQQGYEMTFRDSVYVQLMPDAVMSKGRINYDKFNLTLQKDKQDNPIEIDKREIGKDTIKFTTKSKADLSKVLNRGRLIRIEK